MEIIKGGVNDIEQVLKELEEKEKNKEQQETK